ncbi:hypothetical protein Bca4012_065449 [Brassica carinata]|uniref:Uncharacterized protein n=1 Tax=Brassica carinata TaxID=52824 RepID=A0A8X8AWP8_BRACI|nr:hypothetical protein Bca52824_017787 [Brassica carinata]
MPPFITDMEGKTFNFQVRVRSYNFTTTHQTFTVSHIINEIGRVPAPDYDDNGGDYDDTPDGNPGRGRLASGKGDCEASKSAGKKPVGNAH